MLLALTTQFFTSALENNLMQARLHGVMFKLGNIYSNIRIHPMIMQIISIQAISSLSMPTIFNSDRADCLYAFLDFPDP